MSEPELNVEAMYGDKDMRWYQIAAINELVIALTSGHLRPLIELPTGAGKTLTIAAAMSDPRIRKALNVPNDRPIRVLFAALNHRLLSQAEETFMKDSGVEVTMHSIFSDIPKNVIENGWDVTILDEAHHEACSTFQYHLEHMGEKPIIGLTATSDRADHSLIKFYPIISPISREQAVAEGFLAETELHTIIDSPMKDKTEVTQLFLNSHLDEFGQTMMFFRTKREVSAIHEFLLSRGKKSVALLNQTQKQTDELLTQFSDGEFQFIVNCSKVNEGVDVKGCTDVYLGKQIGSYPQLNQTIGRSSRPDSDSRVWELVNPLSSHNLDTTVVVGVPKSHKLYYYKKNVWSDQEFDYSS